MWEVALFLLMLWLIIYNYLFIRVSLKRIEDDIDDILGLMVFGRANYSAENIFDRRYGPREKEDVKLRKKNNRRV